MSDTKPKYRVQAGSDKRFTTDNFTNFSASLGLGAANLSSGSSYGNHNFLSRNHYQLEMMYRGTWLVKQVVDAPSDDMTRAGITIESDMKPDEMDKIKQELERLLVWQRINSTLKWSRLYGGACAVIMIKGQKLDSPLRVETVGKGQFEGLMVLDRWMLWPHVEDLVDDFGIDFGLPRFYEVISDAKIIPNMKIHHTRCIRLDGIELPYWQKIAENHWGLSVIEPLFDRMVAFDSATQGASQLIYRAHLRTLKIEKLRELIAFGGPAYQAVLQQVQVTRMMQSNEGLTLLDASDEYEAHQYNFGGIADMITQFGQQLSGASQIPLTRLFGQAPQGMNATGESDMRNYYDGIKAAQEARLRLPIGKLLHLLHRSLFGLDLPDGFSFSFNPLYQLNDAEKATAAGQITTAVDAAYAGGVVSQQTALKELRQASRVNGLWSNIRDEDIQAAEDTVPSMAEMAEMGQPEPGEQVGVKVSKETEPGAPPAKPKAKVLPRGAAGVLKSPAHVAAHFGGDDGITIPGKPNGAT